MEPIYGTNKKYLQSIAGSDYYRSPSTLRPMANEYASYQNTLGRRSTMVGPYTHMSKYSYPTDVSLSSHYGYTSWGLWRDSRNLSSSLYAKKQKNIKSFSILLMSAAFIVVLAVLCVAGLAFYFSTFKTDLTDSILAFDCTFRVARGDIYTTGLRSNSTPVYRQKTAFYEKLIDTSLERSGLTVSRTEIMNFGDGPTIVLSFRVFLDMRKIKITINNVEEHIRTAFLSEVLNPNSAFKSIRIDPDSIEIKRLLDQDVLKTALLTRNEPYPPTLVKPSSGGGSTEHPEQRHVTKKTGVIEKTIHKFTPRVPPAPAPAPRPGTALHDDGRPGTVVAESDIDMDNLPVIQGSFEITKTDADITQKRPNGESPVKGPGSPPVAAATLKPFAVSPAQITVRGAEVRPKVTTGEPTKGVGVSGGGAADGKLPAAPSSTGGRFGPVSGKPTRAHHETATAKIEKMDKHGATTKKIKTTSPKPAAVGGGRRATTPAVGGKTATTTKTTSTTSTTSTSTTTTTTTTTTEAPSTVARSKTPTTNTRLTTLRYQVVESQGPSNESSSSASWDDEEGEEDNGSDVRDELEEALHRHGDHYDHHLPEIGGLSEGAKNDTLLETIFQAILNDTMPEEFVPDRRRVGAEADSIPKLDVNLFTSSPVLDKQPWHPINPNADEQAPARRKTSLAEEILYRNRPSDIESSLAYTENPNGAGGLYYQSYTNPSFGSSTLGIEPLGVADVRPYPLPVDKIHEEVIPDFKYLTPTALDAANEQLLGLPLDEEKFEHLGGGVIAKKPDQTAEVEIDEGSETTTSMSQELLVTTASSSESSQSSDESSTEVSYTGTTTTTTTPTTTTMEESSGSGLSGELGSSTHDAEMIDPSMDLESRHSPDDDDGNGDDEGLATTTTAMTPTTTTAGLASSEEQVSLEQLSTTMSAGSSEELGGETTGSTTEVTGSSSEEVSTTTETTIVTIGGGNRNRPSTAYVEVETLKYTPTSTVPTTATLPELFPITKWEFVNGTRRTTAEKPPTRKVFNETLQALVVVDVRPTEPTTAETRPPVHPMRPNATQLQNLSDIFDTLASKLGIQPEMSSKMPPFASLAKIKNQHRNQQPAGPTSTTTARPKRRKTRPTVTTPRTTTTERFPDTTPPMARIVPTVTNEDEIEDVVPVMLETSSELLLPALVGQAEVEVVDPNRYEEMLNSMAYASKPTASATTTPAPPSTLVTLLPVKSNSGIRQFRPKTKRPPSSSATTASPSAASSGDESRRLAGGTGGKLMHANKAATGSAEGVVPVGSNKTNNTSTMVETVVRASMRFES